MNKEGIYYTILLVLFVSFSAVSQSSSKEKTIEEIENADLIEFANNSEVLSSVVTSEYGIRIFEVKSGFNYASTGFYSSQSKVVIALTMRGDKPIMKVYQVNDISNPRDVRWEKIDSVVRFRLNHSSIPHTRTLRFEIVNGELTLK